MWCETCTAFDDIVPMGVKEALALIEREEAQATQPAKRGVVAWVSYEKDTHFNCQNKQHSLNSSP